MAKKYLSLEEAARHVGISVEQLKQLRERGEIRGFSDGGTWKFKTDDVEELVRSRTPDSNPDVPLLTDEALDQDSSIIGMEEEDLVSEQPTVIRGNSALDEDDDDSFLVGMASDSDVQLIPNELLTDDGATDMMVSLGDSDSDVRLIDSSPLTDPGSDSEVKLVGGSDSDVQIVGGSDSDVRFMEDDSDSDVKLVPDVRTEHDMAALEEDSDSDVTLVPATGSGVSLDMHDTDASVFEDDESGISLGDGSSITLAAESGLSLEKIDSDLELKQKAAKKSEKPEENELDIATDDDSGISLEGFDDDSGTSLSEDDFIGLADDSGIELSPADSGIALESLADSGIALDSGNVNDRTMPMIAKSSRGADEDDTAMEMPTLEEDSEYELSMDGATSGDAANIIMFDEEEDFDDRQATVVKKGRGKEPASEEFDLTGDGGDFDLDDSFEEFDEDDDFAGAAVADDDLDVADDVVGEDDELDDLDVFDEGADDFDDDFDAGTSKPDFVAGGLAGPAAVPAPVQTEWGAGPFVGLLLSTLLMAMCGMMMFDLVRSMWAWNEPSSFNSPLLGIVRDMIK